MARETKAEREARVERENAEYQAAQLAAWPDRMMKNLERATNHHGMNLTVVNRKFNVGYNNSYGDRVILQFNRTPIEYSDFSGMEELEWALDTADRKEEEYRRKQALRTSALDKLTKEEREELGL